MDPSERDRLIVERRSKRIKPGSHRMQVTMDSNGLRWIMRIMRRRGMWAVDEDPQGLPPEAAELVRALITEAYDGHVRRSVDDCSPQTFVAMQQENDGWTDEEFAARQLAELYRGLERVVHAMIVPHKMYDVADAAKWSAGEILARDELWVGAQVKSDAIGQHLGEIQARLFFVADRLGVDLASAACARFQQDLVVRKRRRRSERAKVSGET